MERLFGLLAVAGLAWSVAFAVATFVRWALMEQDDLAIGRPAREPGSRRMRPYYIVLSMLVVVTLLFWSVSVTADLFNGTNDGYNEDEEKG